VAHHAIRFVEFLGGAIGRGPRLRGEHDGGGEKTERGRDEKSHSGHFLAMRDKVCESNEFSGTFGM
jgi:hypothetical protein